MSTTLPEQGQPTNDHERKIASELAEFIIEKASTEQHPTILKMLGTMLRQRCETAAKEAEAKASDAKKILALFGE